MRQSRRPGFTLIEAAITTVIVGVGCVAMLGLLASGTVANSESTELTTAINLAGNIREAMAGLRFADAADPSHWGTEAGETSPSAYNDLDDFDAKTFSPPLDARRQSLGSDYSDWSQAVSVQSVRPDQLTATTSHLTLSPEQRPTSRITVTIERHGKAVYSQSWLASYSDP